MNDREMLELAAKAAGIKLLIWQEGGMQPGFLLQDDRRLWNPLADDGDALQLAVDLKIDVSFVWGDGVSAWAPGIDPQDVRYGVDRRSTTRLAITRAAAEIGKQMGGSDV